MTAAASGTSGRDGGARPGPAVHAVVLAYRGWPELQRCLPALLAQLDPPSRVVVVDNHSQDGTPDQVTGAFPSVRVVTAPGNGGYGAGMNLGWRELAPDPDDYILLLTQDALLRPGALDRLAGALDDDDRAAVAGPLLLLAADPQHVWSAGGRLVGPGRAPQHRGTGQRASTWSSAPTSAVPWVDGAVMLVRAAAVTTSVPFREDYFLYWEEVELQVRLGRAGWHAIVVPGACAEQRPGHMPPYLATRNRLRFLRQTEGPVAEGAATAGALLRAVRSAAVPHRRWEARAHLAGLRDAWGGGLDRELADRR